MPLDYSTPTSPFDAYAYYGRNIITRRLQDGLPFPGGGPRPPIGGLPPLQAGSMQRDTAAVGIIGAGVGGLYAGMMLQSLGISFQILEASDRTGGRVFTHKFTDQAHDYYDVGPMRFPESPVMQRLFNLFHCEQLNNEKDDIEVAKSLIKYYFEDKNEKTFLDYNGTSVPRSDSGETFDFEATGVSDASLQEGAKTILKDAYQPFVDALEDDLTKDPPGHRGWDLLKQFDKYSTRGYLSTAATTTYDQPTINWLETMTAGTGWFDQAFAESVLEWIDFGGDQEKAYDWWCLDGGSQVLTDAMTKYLHKHAPKALQLKKEATAIVKLGMFSDLRMLVDVRGDPPLPRRYNHVICTLPLPVLRTLDIDLAGLDVNQTNALRQLQYGPACKIGVKFKTAWWTDQLDIVGGQSYGDRCIRTTVYPSYGLDKDKTTVLIASYTWSHDALRFAGLINPTPEMAEEAAVRLKELVLRDLAHVHKVDRQMLEDQYVDHFAWDWYSSPLAQGAFAFFGPGEFSTLYEELCGAAAFGHLHFAGEALSVRHAWIVGALDSAWRAVLEILTVSYRDKIAEFEEKWGYNEEWAAPQELDGIGADAPGVKSSLLVKHLLAKHPSVAQK